ncbi:hypothetical protein [Corynebacterium striatum]|uniref:hypothetical protein n=1 Tax=Corynebacterium striatum TaxID=43770 RepID=UPI003B5C6153
MNESIIPQKANTVNECRRLLPRGLRIMIATKRPLDDMPEPGQSTWTYTRTGRNLELDLIKETKRVA